VLPDLERGGKRHLALQVMWNTYPIASAIHTGKVESIDNYMLTGWNEAMVSFDELIRRLLNEEKITRAVAEQNVRDVSMLSRWVAESLRHPSTPTKGHPRRSRA
jgi:twitching motility protein PilT